MRRSHWVRSGTQTSPPPVRTPPDRRSTQVLVFPPAWWRTLTSSRPRHPPLLVWLSPSCALTAAPRYCIQDRHSHCIGAEDVDKAGYCSLGRYSPTSGIASHLRSHPRARPVPKQSRPRTPFSCGPELGVRDPFVLLRPAMPRGSVGCLYGDGRRVVAFCATLNLNEPPRGGNGAAGE